MGGLLFNMEIRSVLNWKRKKDTGICRSRLQDAYVRQRLFRKDSQEMYFNMLPQTGDEHLYLKNTLIAILRSGNTSQVERRLPESFSSLELMINISKLLSCLTLANTIAKN